MISKELDDLIHRAAKAEQSYAAKWLENYDTYKTMKAVDMATIDTPQGYQKLVLEKQLEYLMGHDEEQDQS